MQAQKQRGRGSPQTPVQIELQQMTSPPKGSSRSSNTARRPGQPEPQQPACGHCGPGCCRPGRQHGPPSRLPPCRCALSWPKLMRLHYQTPTHTHILCFSGLLGPCRELLGGLLWPPDSLLHIFCTARPLSCPIWPPIFPLASFSALVSVLWPSKNATARCYPG